ncbi:MAG: DUF1338 domain-containing protein [Bacteroidales bacterium]
MNATHIFDRLWSDYIRENPNAGKIHDLFVKSGNRVVNDHIAFRTFNDPRTSLEVIAKPFQNLGYRECGSYHFQDKKLRAKHYELSGEKEAPRVFISELLLEEFSRELQDIVRENLDRVPKETLTDPELIFAGSLFSNPQHGVYQRLREESEYAAWLYVFGFRANHFTVSVNHLETLHSLEEVNEFLKRNGYELNASGGEIKGNPGQLLEQSSTLADRVEVDFTDGRFRIPACYYEFARRYPDGDGNLFSGFVAGSADKIFESTDYRS